VCIIPNVVRYVRPIGIINLHTLKIVMIKPKKIHT